MILCERIRRDLNQQILQPARRIYQPLVSQPARGELMIGHRREEATRMSTSGWAANRRSSSLESLGSGSLLEFGWGPVLRVVVDLTLRFVVTQEKIT